VVAAPKVARGVVSVPMESKRTTPSPPEPKLIEVGGLTTVTMNDLWRARDQKRVARV
jgi:hypothetical protein